MIKILKRLELIKTAVALEDEEIIELQILKLENIENDEKIQEILDLISETQYEHVINLIDAYIEKYKGVTLYEDPEIQGLKVELKILEKDLQDLSEKKNEYLHLINEFNAQSNLRLGELIQEILRLRKELSFEEMKSKSDNNDEFEEAAKQYKQTKQDYEEFSEDYTEQLKEMPLELTEAEARELKQAYRKAGKLCHPDVVIDDVKDKAEEVFKILNDAYAKNDLEAVNKILKDLESGYTFAKSSDVITDKDILRMKIEDIRAKIDSITDEINKIKEEETFQTIVEIDDWGDYFDDLKEQLEEELDELSLVADNKKESVKDIESTVVASRVASGVSEEDDDYWEIPF